MAQRVLYSTAINHDGKVESSLFAASEARSFDAVLSTVSDEMFRGQRWTQNMEWLESLKSSHERVDLNSNLPSLEWLKGATSTTRYRTLAKALGLLAVVWLILSQLFTPWAVDTEQSSLTPSVSYFHLLVPASESNANLCKTLFSAAVIDYPTPRILNWNRKFDDPNLIFGGSHIAKIEGILNFLRQLGPQSDSELGLIIDGYDIWFQLRPSVMIQRYHAINARANARIQKRLGPAADLEHISQRVVFSSQKRCWPAGPDDPACYAAPESDLPPKVYGRETDTDIGDEVNPFAKYRQRYLNSGTIIGPIGDLRAIFERAFEKAKQDSNIGSDQGVFASIFGEQEYQREVIRDRHLTWSQRFLSSDIRDEIIRPHPSHTRMEAFDDTRCEFGIGLDYRSELSQPTVFSENDLAWVRNVNSRPQPSIPDSMIDVKHSTPPLWTFDSSIQTRADWTDVSLYTNTYTGISPVAIHHNAHHDGLKSRIQTFWNQTWYYPHLRPLLKSRASAPRMPTAVLPAADGQRQEWWGPIDERGGMRIENGVLPGDWLGWEDVCGTTEIADEVFRDKKGRWTDTIYALDWNATIATEQLERWYNALDPQS